MSNLDNTLETTNNVESNKVLSDAILDSMSDEEFEAYLNDGSIPERLQDSQEPETEPEDENTPEQEEQAPEELPEPQEQTQEQEVVEPNQEQEQEQEQPEQEQIDYEKAYKELFDTPIKADGTEFKLKNKDELIQLAQKGVNYTRKTQELAKDRKLVQSLREASIDEESLNMLIDVYKGNPEAIKEIVKKHNVEINEYEDSDEPKAKYVPGKNIVSDLEVSMQDVIDEIQRSPHQQQISMILTKMWDAESKDMIMKDPSLLRSLFEEVSMGRFDEIQPKVAYRKQFDNQQIPDLHRYVMILKEQEEKAVTKQQATPPPVKEKVKPIAGDKKAASIQTNTTKTSKRQISNSDLDKMSDEEFLNYYKANK